MRARLPSWFKQKSADPGTMGQVEGLLEKLSLHTICDSAQCPNVGDCFSRRTATFLILGDVCTRNCRFCAVAKGKPLAVDDEEPEHLLAAVAELGLRYVVITSVTRDDLVEVLIPDFQGSLEALRVVVEAGPQVLNHNVETVPRFYPEVRALADYRRSVELLSRVKDLDSGMVTKSGLMLGLGETREEVVEVMRELREARCDLLTLGQYLPPSEQHYPLARFVTPEEFSELAALGRELGFAEVASAPLVRSSFRAAELYAKARN